MSMTCICNIWEHCATSEFFFSKVFSQKNDEVPKKILHLKSARACRLPHQCLICDANLEVIDQHALNHHGSLRMTGMEGMEVLH